MFITSKEFLGRNWLVGVDLVLRAVSAAFMTLSPGIRVGAFARRPDRRSFNKDCLDAIR